MFGGTFMGVTFFNWRDYMDAEVLEKIQQWSNCTEKTTIGTGDICIGSITTKKELPTLTADSLKNKNYVLL